MKKDTRTVETVAREQAEAELTRLQGELAGLQGRRDEVMLLVAERQQAQRAAALESERAGGGDSKALSRTVAAHEEARARLDAIEVLLTEKQAAVDAAAQRLREAAAAELRRQQEAAIAAATAAAEADAARVAAGFRELCLALGALTFTVDALERLDRPAAVRTVRACDGDTLTAELLAQGCKGVMVAGGDSNTMLVSAMTDDPAVRQIDAQTLTVDAILQKRAEAGAPAA